jgi:hypothetical protein
MLERLEVYNLVHDCLMAYDEDGLNDVDLELFIYDLEFLPDSEVSSDPALFYQFEKMCPAKLSLEQSYLVAANFVEAELVKLRGAEVGVEFVDRLRHAAACPATACASLKEWGKKTCGLFPPD